MTKEEKQARIEKTLFGDSLSPADMERELKLFKEIRKYLISTLGEEKGSKLFADFIFNRTERSWRETAELCIDDNSLQGFVKIFWGPLKQSLIYEEEWENENKVSFKVKRCTVCEACKKVGLTDIGYHVYCMTDPAVVRGINPDIKFERSHTLMQGDEYCDHCYTYSTDKEIESI